MSNIIKLNQNTNIDLDKLIDSRLLVQANSGGGKSWILRRMLEQSHGKVQQIIIDLEGEFSTLREKFDYILAGKDGDTPAEPRSAALLARKILELNVSAIIDLYELHHYERIRFVKLFLDSLINAPKNLWHPALVVVDEAHTFCPEKGQSEAASAVIDLATRGRKRGYCAVLATQRLSKLHKDAAAECNNKLIGRTGLDVDMKRAYDELGFNTKEQYFSLRKLEAGEFFAFGPAISNEIKKIKIGEVQTTHPTSQKLGSRMLAVKKIPPTSKIKRVLEKLTDLPKEAEEEAKTISDYKRVNVELKRQLTTAKSHQSQLEPSKKQIEVAVNQVLVVKQREFNSKLKEQNFHIERLVLILKKIGVEVGKVTKDVFPLYQVEKTKVLPGEVGSMIGISTKEHQQLHKITSNKISIHKENELDPNENNKPLAGGALRMLKVLASRFPVKLTRSQLATFSKLKSRTGTFGTYLSILKSRNFIVSEGDYFQATQGGIEEVGITPNPPQSTEENIEMWHNNLKGGARRMFDVLIEIYPDSIEKEDLAQRVGLGVPLSGSFGTYLSILKSNGLVKITGNTVIASDTADLF